MTTELHGTTLNKGYIYRVSVSVCARPWLVISTTERQTSAGMVLTTEFHGTTLNQGYIYRVSVSVRARPWLVMLRVRLVVLLRADVPNVLAQGVVLRLTLEGELVKRHLVGISQTRTHHR